MCRKLALLYKNRRNLILFLLLLLLLILTPRLLVCFSILSSVQREMLEHLADLHASRQHRAAEELWNRLRNLRREVEDMARGQEATIRDSQRTQLAAAEAMARRNLAAQHRDHREKVAEVLKAERLDVRAKHAIERANLEERLAAAPWNGRVRYSKRFLELVDIERKLARGHPGE